MTSPSLISRRRFLHTATSAAGADPLQLIDVDHVRFYVGNAKQAAFFYAHCFGFQIEQTG